jgi:hypothetical protein
MQNAMESLGHTRAPGRPSIARLRAMGVARSGGRFVAITEDHCIAQPGWLQALAESAKLGARVIGGVVENACRHRGIDRAAFLCEYGRFLPPADSCDLRDLPGNNCAYARELLEPITGELSSGPWDWVLQKHIRKSQVPTSHCPSMIVAHKKSFTIGGYFSERFHCSRSFAGTRLQHSAWWTRLAYTAATALLPAVLLARMAVKITPKRGCAGRFWTALPWLSVFVAVGSLGEAAGALFGPGDSAEKVTG